MRMESSRFRTFQNATDTDESKAERQFKQSPDLPSELYVETFEELSLLPRLVKNLRYLCMERPNSLQRHVLPLLITNQTGSIYIKSVPHSGKKTAFLINALQRINPDLPETQAVIIAPTTELVCYITEAARDLARNMNVRVFQATKEDQPEQARPHLVVTTLGTFLWLRRNRLIELNRLRCLIFDELDLLMNTEKKILNTHSIIEQLGDRPANSLQLLFFSTSFCDRNLYTVKRFVVRGLIIRKYLRKTTGLPFGLIQFKNYSPNDTIKEGRLITVLLNTIKDRVVVYSHPWKAEQLANFLAQHQFRVVLIRSNSKLKEIQDGIRRFNLSKKQTVLCMSYPIGHGIPLNDVSVLINFDLPTDDDFLPVEYLHRLSKCNTVNEKPAFIVNLVDPDSKSRLKRLEDYYKTEMMFLELENALENGAINDRFPI